MDAGLPDKIVPPADNKPLPPRLPEERWDAMSDAEHQEYLDELAEIHGENASLEGKRLLLAHEARYGGEARR